ncbi:diguanylate cyclase (GGDEF)-like protein [Kineococcus xinjiangensis]|uniref:Diguanylate cyclase (GGDEF)-like protein n=1 Tax=Kineococcus xinjiangensis TaxID=512762 RepID=A0A2S6IHV7_9ACTN|nr:EAL domain-containing protein [Kineococcus xinjiangensis]PPK93766.1 diguanylate cyclase (GGDEF)-like protein [Kineococcus xinjiangensis]
MSGAPTSSQGGQPPPARTTRQPGFRLLSPPVLTSALTAVLAAAGIALTLQVPETPLLTAPSGTALLVATAALFVAFFVTELAQALVEIRRQAYAFSLSGIPMIVGLLYLPPLALIVGRLVATTIAFALQRASPLKFTYNSAAYLLESALIITIAHRLVGDGAALDLQTALWCYVSLAIVDLLMSGLVLLVITINQGMVSKEEIAGALIPASAFVALNCTVAFIGTVLLSAGALGTALLLAFVAVTAVIYRGYLILRRRHSSLVLVQEFIEQGEISGTVEEVAERLLTHVRTLVRAAHVELTLHDDDPSTATRISVDEAHRVTIESGEEVALDWPSLHARQGGEALLLGERGGTPGQQRWLRQRGARDALVVPLSRSETAGVLVALDRLGDTITFTPDDLALLQALAGHLAVAVHSRRLMQQLRYEATHDALTGLPNRTMLGERLSEALGSERGAAVVLLDLNRFKEVNDALGHHVGDQLLRVVARRLRETVRPEATVARLGGDEFALLLPSEAGADIQADALAVAHRVERALRTPVDLAGVSVSTDASLGVAVAAPGESHTDLLRHADTAMYAGKTAGTGVMVYTPALDRGRAERLALLADLHAALEEGGLHLRYQPKLDLARGAVTSVEALVRWAHPALGPLTPDTFIPLAESTGLIDQLTKVVLSQALRQCRAWQDEGYELAVAVNLSARNINDTSLPEHVAGAIVEAGVPARKLILEITESSVMGDPERTVPVLQRLSDIGVTLSLDDFGTGHSSLSYLQRLPVRELKIDRSFVRGLSLPREAQASAILVRSIVGLGRSLDLRIVAEGVENAETLDQLRDYGCDVIQGYYVGRPLPAEDVDAAGPFRVLMMEGPA